MAYTSLTVDSYELIWNTGNVSSKGLIRMFFDRGHGPKGKIEIFFLSPGHVPDNPEDGWETNTPENHHIVIYTEAVRFEPIYAILRSEKPVYYSFRRGDPGADGRAAVFAPKLGSADAEAIGEIESGAP